MIAKILVIVAFLVLLMYVVLPKRGVLAAPPGTDQRTYTALLLTAVVMLIASLCCVAFWLGQASSGAGQERSTLLPIAGVLLAVSVACAGVALLKRRR
ncbi:Uncharacterised protein [Bordetella ansorpii]|uniref:Uncharacterized protein n=1 Tax=Bordetella ansorpii TaxID=288768 RepID=A0A157SPH4_9BORD|nr:hypothetical protein [Bordetella ansorpii]SAI71776.1 Uncharacterised protein [Bordetella ansorpii]